MGSDPCLAQDYIVHSDLLVHWTGRDIEDDIGTGEWWKDPASKTSGALSDRYVGRLLDILKHGLWMTTEPATRVETVGETGTLPPADRTCFTELRLSESRKHAMWYGRLGIAVKRPFAFNRGGRPVVYYGGEVGQFAKQDLFFAACCKAMVGSPLLQYFKPMCRGPGCDYSFYAESEWRVVFDRSLLKHGSAIDPRDPSRRDANCYLKRLPEQGQEKLRYLIPLDGWLAAIIYPSLHAKQLALGDRAVREEIARIKGLRCRANSVEPSNWPVEMDLDLCRSF